jgi:predicted TIM-barrel fold metal-dependent hydrolase
MTKSFPVLDCDAHINDPIEIWTKYVEPEYRDVVQQSYWCDDEVDGILNGRWAAPNVLTRNLRSQGMYNPGAIAGPQMNVKLMRRLQKMGLTESQVDYLDHPGAYEPKPRLADMDLMGIDQVVVIPTNLIRNFPYIDKPLGAYGLARAYNNWVFDYCSADTRRLFPAILIPLHEPKLAAAEIERCSSRGAPVGLVRPVDSHNGYPNLDRLRPVFRALEETGMVLGVHAFPQRDHPEIEGRFVSPGEYQYRSGDRDSGLPSSELPQILGFMFEGITWIVQALMSGFLDRYPRLRVAVLECNATWLPSILAHCDRLAALYEDERRYPLGRLPSQAFREQCFIGFESDEESLYRNWEFFQDIAVWASDCYHHDAADAWSALRHMARIGVPDAARRSLLGGNAARMYGIEQQVFVNEESGSVPRPDWFPHQDDGFRAWVETETRPARNGRRMEGR